MCHISKTYKLKNIIIQDISVTMEVMITWQFLGLFGFPGGTDVCKQSIKYILVCLLWKAVRYPYIIIIFSYITDQNNNFNDYFSSIYKNVTH